MVANPQILDGQEVRANIPALCRLTRAAEASHLAESGDWIIVLLEEALTGEVDLRNWTQVIERRKRVYVTDAKSVYDYLQRDATSTSSDPKSFLQEIV